MAVLTGSLLHLRSNRTVVIRPVGTAVLKLILPDEA